MTPLKHSILHVLKKHGPLSDLGIWGKLGDQETGGFSAIVVIADLELNNAGYIEPAANNPHAWQLTDEGLAYVAFGFLDDEALDLEILRTLESMGAHSAGPGRSSSLSALKISERIGVKACGSGRVAIRCQSLYERALIFAAAENFWKISVSGRLMLRNKEVEVATSTTD